jgi:hypothetical protein
MEVVEKPGIGIEELEKLEEEVTSDIIREHEY